MDYEILQTLEEDFVSSNTYKVIGNRILGMVDGLDAVRQAIEKILATERFRYSIYSENYGVELNRFIGADIEFVRADLARTIEEALQADERISGISNFEIERQQEKDTLVCYYDVDTVEGSFPQRAEVLLSG